MNIDIECRKYHMRRRQCYDALISWLV